jgi:hypothetical protein
VIEDCCLEVAVFSQPTSTQNFEILFLKILKTLLKCLDFVKVQARKLTGADLHTQKRMRTIQKQNKLGTFRLLRIH